MPAELKPAATKKPEHSGASPSMYWLSGVKDSGPLTQLLMVACSSDGMRCWAPSQICSIKCYWSSGRSEKAKSGGTPDVQIGFACASKPPTSSPVPHSRK